VPGSLVGVDVARNDEDLRPARGLSDRRAVDDVITRLGLRPYADNRAWTLSPGNAQRLGLAKALIHRPDLLVLDEPASGLGPAGVAEIRALLHDLACEHGITVLLSSHILTEAATLSPTSHRRRPRRPPRSATRRRDRRTTVLPPQPCTWR